MAQAIIIFAMLFIVAMASIIKYYHNRKIYRSHLFAWNSLVYLFHDIIGNYTSKENIRKELFGVVDFYVWEAMDAEIKARPFMLDIARCNVLMGYRTEKLDTASMLEFNIYKRITDYKNSGYEHFVECSEDPAKGERYVSLFRSWEEEVASTPSPFMIAQLLEKKSHKLMNKYLLALIEYCNYVASKTRVSSSSVNVCIYRIESMMDKGLLEYEEKIESLRQTLEKFKYALDSLEATKKRIEEERNKPYVPAKPETVFLDRDFWDMTKDYMGKHGEFDYNDEARRISEDIQQFHNANPDADLYEHYYWEDILNAETDGYLDD